MIKTIATGNLGKDAEVKTSQKTGKQFISFTMASTTGKDLTTWFNCGLFNEKLVAGNFAQYLKKGTKVMIIGAYIPRIWQKDSGEGVLDHSFMVHEIELLSPKGSQSAPEPGAPIAPAKTEKPAAAAAAPAPSAKPPTTEAAEDDDLPF